MPSLRPHISHLLLLCISAIAANGQEMQVPLDWEGRYERIDAELEGKLGIFPGVESFEEARLYLLPDSTFALEVFYNPAGDRLKRRTIMSHAAVDTFRLELSKAVARLPEITIDQEGRALLITGTTIYSLGYYGWALPVALNIDDTKTSVALYMLTASAGFFVPYFATENSRVTAGAATLGLGGGALGIPHGILLGNLIVGRSAKLESQLAFGMMTSVAELVGGYYIADGSRMTAGKAEVIFTGGLFGMGLGLGTAQLLDLFDSNEVRGGSATGLIGSGLGYAAGNVLANMQSYTTGDAQVLFGAGLLGGYIPLAFVDMTGTEDEKPYIAASMGGSLLGLAAGHYLVKGHDFRASEGSFIVLGELAGGLLGLGIAYLAAPENSDNSTLYLSASAAGGLGGFGFMYGILSKDRTAREKDSGSLWNFRIAPEGIAAAALGTNRRLPDGATIPLLEVRGRF